MNESQDNVLRPPKRASAGQQSTNESRKRRARYALRACDACRRRKGRCDGRKPCEYCQIRAFECCYAIDSEEQLHNSVSNTATPVGDFTTLPKKSSVMNPENIDSITGLVAALQGQLDGLMAQMKPPPAEQTSFDVLPASTEQSYDSDVRFSNLTSTVPLIIPPPAANCSKRTTHRFHGPVSPDYSLNAAEIKIRQSQHPAAGSSEKTNPSVEDDETDDEEPVLYPEANNNRPNPRRQSTHMQELLQWPLLLSKREAVRLLDVYQEVIGDLHPIVDTKRLVEQVEICYALAGMEQDPRHGEGSIIDENTLILCLALSIAFAAETVTQSRTGKTLYNSLQNIIKIRVASRVTSLKHVIITLLLGIHHFFCSETQLAWRMCGVAGRTAMELGLHRRDVVQHCLENEKQRAEVKAVICSIFILDRQWSAATGLPQNFQDEDFDQVMDSPDNAPYLKAMLSYITISPIFGEPICRVTAGGTCEDDDSFELLNFRINQWRKSVLEGHQFIHPSTCDAPSRRPSSMTTLLYLRANAMQGLLLRSYFISNSPSPASRKRIKAGLEYVSDTIWVLSTLDETTDIYRKQHPFFQHFLTSSCAVLFLIVAYAEQNHAALSSDFPDDFSETVRRGLHRALRLAAAYSNSSRASRRLWKRLLLMKDPLLRLGILPCNDSSGDNALAPVVSRRPPVGATSKLARFLDKSGLGKHHLRDGVAFPDYLDSNGVPDLMDGPIYPDADVSAGLWDDFDSLLYDWPGNEIGNIFSEGG